jgi:glycosyltransferase involved in cell wall biosynthesis
LAQSYADLEVVIVDNYSSDGTSEILQKLNDDRVRIFRNATTVPVSDNWNLAVQRSEGEFVKLLCADDTLEPECVAAQIKVLQDNPDVTLVAVRTNFLDGEGKVLRRAQGLAGIAGQRSGEHVVRQIVRSGCNPIGAPGVGMFRRVDFDQCAGFKRDFAFETDVDFWVRLLRHGDFFGLTRTLASFRIHSESITALTSVRSQLAEQIEFARRLADDPHWKISIYDRIVGRINCYIMQMRRTAIFFVTTLRASWRRRHAIIEQLSVGFSVDGQKLNRLKGLAFFRRGTIHELVDRGELDGRLGWVRARSDGEPPAGER